MNGQAILQWMKSNVVIVVCLVVTIGAPIGLWYVSSGWSAEVQADVKKRGRQLDELANAGKAQFSWPGQAEQTSIVVTPDIVAAYQSRATLLQGQADAVVDIATQRNAAGFDNHFPELLPYPNAGQWEAWDEAARADALDQALQVVPSHLHARLMQLYQGLLDQLSAGTPPDPADVDARLATMRDSYAQGHSGTDSLSEEERDELAEKLGAKRMAMYQERAGELGVYLTLDTLAPPSFASTDIPDHDTIAQWLWRYWVMQRMAEAVHAVNADVPEPGAAIKRIQQVAVRGLLELDTPDAGDRSFSGSGGRGGGSGDPPRGPGGGGGDPPRGPGGGGPGGPPRGPGGGGGGPGMPGMPGAGPTGPTAPEAGATDRTKSITGHISNQLYDVVLLDLDLIVATDRIGDVLGAFSEPIKMAVLDVDIAPVDSYAALHDGYFYGPGAMSRLVITVETLWLRAWTGPHMPDTVLAELGFPARSYETAEETSID